MTMPLKPEKSKSKKGASEGGGLKQAIAAAYKRAGHGNAKKGSKKR